MQLVQLAFPGDAQAFGEGNGQVIRVRLREGVFRFQVQPGLRKVFSRTARQEIVARSFPNRRRRALGVQAHPQHPCHARRPTAHDGPRPRNLGHQVKPRLPVLGLAQDAQKIRDRLIAKSVGVRKPARGLARSGTAVVTGELDRAVGGLRKARQPLQIRHFTQQRTGGHRRRGQIRRPGHRRDPTHSQQVQEVFHIRPGTGFYRARQSFKNDGFGFLPFARRG